MAEASAGGAPMDLSPWIRQRALELGFSRAGVCRAHPPRDGGRLREWLAAGNHATMEWMERSLPERLEPERLLAGARSVLVVALNYAASAPAADQALGDDAPLGRVSLYARGRDYHRALVRRLETLRADLARARPGCRSRVCADTSPLLERYWAQATGLGWIGKNTNLIVQGLGSWVFLGALLCDVELEESEPMASERCGSCRRCLDVCPTQAFDGPWKLDARRCISYLTIEHRGDIEPGLADRMGDWVFGCDDCQTVCPWNRFAVPTAAAELEEDAATRLPLPALARMDEAGFDALTRRRAWRRSGRTGLRRNALVALGNSGDARAVPPVRATLDDPEPVLRRQAARSMARLALAGRAADAAPTLRARMELEGDPETRRALAESLQALRAREARRDAG